MLLSDHWVCRSVKFKHATSKYVISQLRIVRSGFHLVTDLDVGKFCDKSTKTALHEICMQIFLRFSDSSKPSKSVVLIYKFAWLFGFRESEKNLLKTSCKAVSMTKVAHIFWWRHDKQKLEWGCPNGTKYPPWQPIQTIQVMHQIGEAVMRQKPFSVILALWPWPLTFWPQSP